MTCYKVVPEQRDDGNHKALLVAIDSDGTERRLVSYENFAEAEASRKFLEELAKRKDTVAD